MLIGTSQGITLNKSAINEPTKAPNKVPIMKISSPIAILNLETNIPSTKAVIHKVTAKPKYQ